MAPNASNKLVNRQTDLQLWQAGFVTVTFLKSFSLAAIVLGWPAANMARTQMIFKLGVILDGASDLDFILASS